MLHGNLGKTFFFGGIILSAMPAGEAVWWQNQGLEFSGTPISGDRGRFSARSGLGAAGLKQSSRTSSTFPEFAAAALPPRSAQPLGRPLRGDSGVIHDATRGRHPDSLPPLVPGRWRRRPPSASRWANIEDFEVDNRDSGGQSARRDPLETVPPALPETRARGLEHETQVEPREGRFRLGVANVVDFECRFSGSSEPKRTSSSHC